MQCRVFGPVQKGKKIYSYAGSDVWFSSLFVFYGEETELFKYKLYDKTG